MPSLSNASTGPKTATAGAKLREVLLEAARIQSGSLNLRYLFGNASHPALYGRHGTEPSYYGLMGDIKA
jgi:hypothetical protein